MQIIIQLSYKNQCNDSKMILIKTRHMQQAIINIPLYIHLHIKCEATIKHYKIGNTIYI